MRRRKRRTGGEINLTPLLDVLFSILFLIMLANFSSQNQLQQAFAESGGQLEEEIEALTKERDDLAEENARLLEEGEALAEDYALLQGENLELSGEKELLTAENQKLGGEITGLMNVISQLNSDNSALAAEASQMQEEIDELSHEKRVVEGLSGTYQAFETMCTFVTVINSECIWRYNRATFLFQFGYVFVKDVANGCIGITEHITNIFERPPNRIAFDLVEKTFCHLPSGTYTLELT